MTNKELAVQLYTSHLQAQATILSNPNHAASKVKTPTYEDMVEDVRKIASLLSEISDN